MPPQTRTSTPEPMPTQMPPASAPPPAPAPVAPPPASSGSGMLGGVMLLIIVLAIIFGAYYWYATSQSVVDENAGTEPTATLPTGSDTADAALDQDLGAIDAQIGAFGSDNANVTSGLSDVAVPQSSL